MLRKLSLIAVAAVRWVQLHWADFRLGVLDGGWHGGGWHHGGWAGVGPASTPEAPAMVTATAFAMRVDCPDPWGPRGAS